MEVQGTFNAQRFFDTLAMIISQREGRKSHRDCEAAGAGREKAAVSIGAGRKAKVFQ